MNGITIEKLAKELCEKSGCHHKCHDTKDCVVEDEALLLINENKSNNSDFKSNNFEVKSNEELFKQALVEGLNRHFDREIEEAKKIEQIEEMARKTHFRLYKVWENMKSRCYNPKHKSYHRYGGRGITVCNQWKADFGAFEKWALESGYDGNAKRGQCTLDRIDNDKGYSPENCQWITNQENCNKTNFNLMYTHDGKTQSLADWSRDLGIKYNCLLSRMHRNGFDFEQAIIPRKNGSRHLIYDGAKMKGGE